MALRIRQLRQQRGWTQGDLAALAHISRSQLAMIEKETRPANTLRLNSIAAALGVTTEELFASGGERAELYALIDALDPADRAMIVHLAESLAAKRQPVE